MNMYELNPIEKISVNGNVTMLTTTNTMGECMYEGIKNNITDNRFTKFGAFVYEETDVWDILNLNQNKLTLFELKCVRTTSDVSMWEQTIRFDIIIPPPIMGDKQLGIYNLTTGCILHPKILNIDNESIVCFLVDDIIKSRAKKIKKMMNK